MDVAAAVQVHHDALFVMHHVMCSGSAIRDDRTICSRLGATMYCFAAAKAVLFSQNQIMRCGSCY